MYTFQQIEPTDSLWAQIEQSADATCFHTKAWYKHLQKTYHYEPFIVTINHEDNTGGGILRCSQIWQIYLCPTYGHGNIYTGHSFFYGN